ncbi:MAG: zeta toxin family protein [Faecousia sp.]
MKTYTIIGGVNGVGKSSFTGVLKERSTDLGVIVDVDRITAELGGNALTGGKAALRKIRECIDKGVSFTQETTLSGYKTEATAKQVKGMGYHVRLFYIGLDSAEESLARIENRVKRGGHDIPHDDVLRRFAGRWEAVSKVLPYCDEAEFYDNDNGFTLVAEYRNGELRTIGSRVPQWLEELQEYLNE